MSISETTKLNTAGITVEVKNSTSEIVMYFDSNDPYEPPSDIKITTFQIDDIIEMLNRAKRILENR